MHVFRVRQITTEVLLWLVALSPDFDAFSAIHQQGLLPILYGQCRARAPAPDALPERR